MAHLADASSLPTDQGIHSDQVQAQHRSAQPMCGSVLQIAGGYHIRTTCAPVWLTPGHASL